MSLRDSGRNSQSVMAAWLARERAYAAASHRNGAGEPAAI